MKNIKSLGVLLFGVAIGFTSCQKEAIDTSKSFKNKSFITEKNISNWIEEIQGRAVKRFKDTPVKTVNYVDLSRYAGRWYEIANYTRIFNIGCNCTTADYALTASGNAISVFNNCIGLLSNTDRSVTGKATVVDPETNSKLALEFENVPFSKKPGNYWIIDLVTYEEGKPYDFAVVSGPDRKSLFILSRRPRLSGEKDEQAIRTILENLFDQQYDLSKLRVSLQLDSCEYPVG